MCTRSPRGSAEKCLKFVIEEGSDRGSVFQDVPLSFLLPTQFLSIHASPTYWKHSNPEPHTNCTAACREGEERDTGGGKCGQTIVVLRLTLVDQNSIVLREAIRRSAQYENKRPSVRTKTTSTTPVVATYPTTSTTPVVATYPSPSTATFATVVQTAAIDQGPKVLVHLNEELSVRYYWVADRKCERCKREFSAMQI